MSEEIIPTCGAVIFNSKGQVALVEHTESAGHQTGSVGIVAGKIESGESALEAAVRETKEELGLTVPVEQFRKLPTMYHAVIEQKSGPKNFSWEVYTARADGELIPSEETIPQWFAIENIPESKLLPNVKNAIDEAQGIIEASS